MKKLLKLLGSITLLITSTTVTSCTINFKYGNNNTDDNKPPGFLETNTNNLNSYKNGAEWLRYESYRQFNYLDQRFVTSTVAPIGTYVKKDDEVKVYLDLTKMTSAEVSLLTGNDTVFLIGLDGEWQSTLSLPAFINTQSTSRAGITVESYEEKDGQLILKFIAPKDGLLYQRIAATLNIVKVVVNDVEDDISKKC
ncbi:hypothetical protein SCLARK_001161 [Spiroplasma clarkii]|uniref:hypothetical protein n=1 Tax=Spiroplasma clarkii TaxID=2139 RepID=UPI000B57FD09|nr:hypothetical protein [Spiroplasma clarkii]ARU91720.1 hypothetical protein SCLARK_001161 [Spiroplasma clarkii]